MMRTFHGIESDDEDEAKETSEKKMSLIDRIKARHFAEKKATQEAKAKEEEVMEIVNVKSENVKPEPKQEGKMLRFKETSLGKTMTRSGTRHLGLRRFEPTRIGRDTRT